jgi:hypothetical protein
MLGGGGRGAFAVSTAQRHRDSRVDRETMNTLECWACGSSVADCRIFGRPTGSLNLTEVLILMGP